MENQEQARDRSGHSRRREGIIRHDDNNSSEQAQIRIRTRTRSQSGSGRSSPIDERVSSRVATSPTSVLASMPPPPSDAAASPVLLQPAEEGKAESDVELEEEKAESDVELEEEVVEIKLGSDPLSEPVPVPAPSAEGSGSSEPLAPVDRQQKKRDSQEQHDLQKAKEDAKIEALKATILELQAEEQALIKKLRGEGSAKDIINQHIQKLHEYNEIKDVGQVILGKCAELEGTTIRQQYENFGLDPTD
ncbi:swi5-like zinc finger protein [Mortierella antarctica]|nr:swi5-like zinc finger protein [Mortierella antarctica]